MRLLTWAAVITRYPKDEALRAAFERYRANDPIHDRIAALPTPSGRGIVTSANNLFAPMVEAMILSARHFGSTLPVEIHHSGSELSGSARRRLSALEGVEIVDTAERLGVRSRSLRGWQIKPHALAASRFAEALVVDADVLWFERPERVFGAKGYAERGVFLFRDRDIGNAPPELRHPAKAWLLDKLADWPEAAAAIAPTHHLYHFVEAGVVAWNRGIVGPRALALVLFLNGPWRKAFYHHFHGDKESWWIGCALAGHDPALAPLGPGALRARRLDNGEIAHFEQMLHFDPDDASVRLWCQGSHLHRKNGRRRLVTHDASTGPGVVWKSPREFAETPVAELAEAERTRLRRSAERLGGWRRFG